MAAQSEEVAFPRTRSEFITAKVDRALNYKIIMTTPNSYRVITTGYALR